MSIALSLHILAAAIWVGGMFFAYVCLRPVAAQQLEPPARLALWQQVFARFSTWVWAAVLLLIISGHSMIAIYGGFKSVGMHIHIMLLSGYTMMAIFGHLYFNSYKKLSLAVKENRWPEAGEQLNKIRKIVAINLTLGLATMVVASGGKFLL